MQIGWLPNLGEISHSQSNRFFEASMFSFFYQHHHRHYDDYDPSNIDTKYGSCGAVYINVRKQHKFPGD
jgi:hypothetical protein